MEVMLHSPSPGGEKTPGELTDVSKQVWEFVESQCFTPTGEMNQPNVAFWLRTLLQQNSDLVEVVARLERESKDRVGLLESKLNKTTRSASDLSGGLVELQDKLREEDEFKQLMEDTIKELEQKLKESVEDNKASELLVDTLVDKNKEIVDTNSNLEEKIKSSECDNNNLRDYTENLRSDIDALLKLSSRARDTGVWDPHDLNFCEVTFEQIFGEHIEQAGSPGDQPKVVSTPVKKMSEGENSQHSSLLYDSRSSLESDLMDLQKKGKTGPQEAEDISLRSDMSSRKIRDLRQQVLRTQQRCSDQVKEAVLKDRQVAELQTQITELNGEMDDLKEENNANLSVINKLKDSLYETKSRLALFEGEGSETVSLTVGRLSSTASLPDIPPEPYSSKFARSLTRRQSGSSGLVQQLTDQLDLARRDQRGLEHQVRELLTQVELTTTEKLQLETQLLQVKGELQEVAAEHENLKDDFRTLVRNNEDRPGKYKEQSPNFMNHSSRIHEVGRSHELLIANEERLEMTLQKLQQRDKELERLEVQLDIVNRELQRRDSELTTLVVRCEGVQEELEEQTLANSRLTEMMEQMKQTIGQLQQALEGRRMVEVVEKPSSQRTNIPLPVRVIYKGDSELSDGEEGLVRALSRTPSSFIMSSSDSFDI